MSKVDEVIPDSLCEHKRSQTDYLVSGILSMIDNHHKMLGDHERALRIVADTESKAADAINICLWLNVFAIAMAAAALALEVFA